MISNKIFDFMGPSRVHFEVGGSKKIGEMVKSFGGKRVFIATDSGIVNAKLLEGMLSSIEREGLSYKLFDEIEPNPSLETVEKGFGIFKEGEGDFLIGFGGASPIDTAKAIAVPSISSDVALAQYGATHHMMSQVATKL